MRKARCAITLAVRRTALTPLDLTPALGASLKASEATVGELCAHACAYATLSAQLAQGEGAATLKEEL